MTELVLEHLKRIHADIGELKKDTREIKASLAMQLTMTGELVKSSGRADERFAELEARIDRIEHRLDLRE